MVHSHDRGHRPYVSRQSICNYNGLQKAAGRIWLEPEAVYSPVVEGATEEDGRVGEMIGVTARGR